MAEEELTPIVTEQPILPSPTVFRGAAPSIPGARDPSFFETATAAANAVNPIVNFLDLVQRPEFDDDLDFNPVDALKKTRFMDTDHKFAFLGARSQEEFDAIAGRIDTLEKNFQTTSDAGALGLVSLLVAGALSPTIALPLLHGAKGIRAFGQGAKLGALGAGLDETVLTLAQEGLGVKDAAFGISAGAILGGVLGGAVGNLPKRSFNQLAYDMVHSQGKPVQNIVNAQGTDTAVKTLVPQTGVYRVPRSSIKIDTGDKINIPVKSRQVIAAEEAVGKIKKQLSTIKGKITRDTNALAKGVSDERKAVLEARIADNKVAQAEANKQLARNEKGVADIAKTEAAGTPRSNDIDFSPNGLLAVTPDSLPLIAKTLNKPVDAVTQADTVKFARDSGFDSVVAQDLPSARFKNDEITVFEPATLKEADGIDPNPVSHKYGTGVGDDFVPIGETPTSAGAAAVPDAADANAGKLAPTFVPLTGGNIEATKLTDRILKLSPVAWNINQPFSKTLRWMTAQISNAGLVLEKNKDFIPSAKGGNVEHRMTFWQAGVSQVAKDLDEQYAKYVFGTTPTGLQTFTAGFKGLLANDKLTKIQFSERVTIAGRNGDLDPEIPEVTAVAKSLRTNVYDPLFKEAQRRGIFGDTFIDIDDTSYINRIFDHDAIKANEPEFIRLLADAFEKQAISDFDKAVSKFNERVRQDETFISDIKLNAEDAAKLREDLLQQLKRLENDTPEKISLIEDQLQVIKNRLAEGPADDLESAKLGAERDALRKEAKELAKAAGEPFKELKASKAGIRRRLRNLNENRARLAEEQQKVLDKIDGIDDASQAALQRTARRTQKILNKLDSVDSKFEAQLDRLRTTFDSALGVFKRGEAQLEKLKASPKSNIESQLLASERGLKRLDKLQTLRDKIDRLEFDAANSDVLKAELQSTVDEVLERVQQINDRRTRRAIKLEERAKKLDPSNADKRIENLRNATSEKRLQIMDRFRLRGAEDVDFDKVTLDIREHMEADARSTMNSILKTQGRLPTLSIMADKRGPELARRLHMPDKMHRDRLNEFLVNDMETVMRTYVRTLSADVEMARAFGDPLGAKYIDRILEEKAAAKKGATINFGAGSPEVAKIEADFTRGLHNLEVLIERVRHTRGIAPNPQGASARLGRLAINLNVMRLMGSVTISSIPDLMRPIAKFGLTSTFRDGYIPFITNMKQTRMSGRELAILRSGLEVRLQSRTKGMYDMMDENLRAGGTTRIEQAVEFGASRMGLIAGFSIWTQEIKHLTSIIANAKAMDSIDLVLNGTGTRKEIAEAQEFLAAGGIDADIAQRIWSNVTNGKGGNKVNGKWLPNTDEWDTDTARAYFAFLNNNVDDTIITPGFERPAFADADKGNLPLRRMLLQFKSFAMASTTKTLLAGLQRRDLQFMQSVLGQLALGSMSYFIWASTVGGKAFEEMQNASLEKWADEAISRSGILAIFSEVQRIAEAVPLINSSETGINIANFSGQPSTRRGGAGSLARALGGPSADLINRGLGVITGIHEPTKGTLNTARNMTPFQNVFWLRWMLTQIQNSVGEDLPERRGK